MTDPDETIRLLSGATAHVIEAERLLARVEMEDAVDWIEPLRCRIQRCAAEISVLSASH